MTTSEAHQDDDSCDVSSSNNNNVSLTKQAFYGGPIPCVKLLNDDDGDDNHHSIVFGRGPYLVHVPQQSTASASLASSSSSSSLPPQEQSLLVFDQPGQNVHGICWSHQKGIDAPIVNHSFAMVHGGRQVAFVHKQRRRPPQENDASYQLLPIRKQQGDETLMSMAAPDWIWDGFLVRNDSSPSSSASSSARNDHKDDNNSSNWTLYLGLAHNAVQVWHLQLIHRHDQDITTTATTTTVHLQSTQTVYQGSRRSISYSLCFDPLSIFDPKQRQRQHSQQQSPSLDVAVGTVTNEILLWSLPSEEERIYHQSTTSSNPQQITTITESHILRGHKGVIHAVQFCTEQQQQHSSSQRLLASASDDRSIRLWQEQGSVSNNDSGHDTTKVVSTEWTCRWVGWGHTARCWNVTFVMPPIQQAPTPSFVASCSEDGTIQLWSTTTGQSVATWHGPAGGSYWSVAHTKGMVVAGANDGTVHLYNMCRVPIAVLSNEETTALYGMVDAALRGSFRTTILVPDDRLPLPVPDPVTITDETKPRKKKKPKTVQQTLVGVEFVHDKEESWCLRVATRDASLFELNLQTLVWEKCLPWWDETLRENHGIEAAHGCCTASHDSGNFLLVGMTRGKVCLVHGTNRAVLDGASYKTVQKLEWLNPHCLLVYHVQALRCWKFSGDWVTSSLASMADSAQVTTYLTQKKPVLSSAAFNPSESLMVVGNTRGNLNLFQVPTEASPNNDEIIPCSSITVHQKEHINAIVWTSDDTFLSAGNDGHLRETRVIDGKRLVSFLSVPVRAFTAIDRIWWSTNGSIKLGGYNSNDYSVVDFQTSLESFRVETGGRGRSLTISEMEKDSQSIVLSCVIAARKDGLNDLILGSQKSVSPLKNETVVARSTYGASMHTETLFDTDLFEFKTGVKCMVTASEDCTSRLSVWDQDWSMKQQVAFPAQESGVRAVCCQRLPEDDSRMFVVEGGSKLVLRFYVAHLDQTGKVSLQFLAEGSPNDNATIDHRINDVKAIPFRQGTESYQLAVAGDSNGNVFAYKVPLGAQQHRRISGELIFQNVRPVLSLEMLEINDRMCFVVIGNSAGEVVIVSVPLSHVSLSSATIMHSTKGHSVGTNSISATIMPPSNPKTKHFRICSGGDDQSLFCFDFNFHGEGSNGALLSDFREISKGHQVSISAIRGISWLDQSHVAVSGYGQRVSVWKLDHATKVFRLVAISDTEIGDVNALSAVQEQGSKRFTISVAGIGAQLFSIKLS